MFRLCSNTFPILYLIWKGFSQFLSLSVSLCLCVGRGKRGKVKLLRAIGNPHSVSAAQHKKQTVMKQHYVKVFPYTVVRIGVFSRMLYSLLNTCICRYCYWYFQLITASGYIVVLFSGFNLLFPRKAHFLNYCWWYLSYFLWFPSALCWSKKVCSFMFQSQFHYHRSFFQ